MFKLFLRYLRGSKKHLFFAIILLFLLSYIRSIVPVLTVQILAVLGREGQSTLPTFIANLIRGDIKQQLYIVCIVLLIAYFIRESLNLLYDLELTNLSESVSLKMQRDFFAHIQDLSYTDLTSLETGDLIQRSINDSQRFKRFFRNTFPNFIIGLVLISMYAYQMFLFNWKLALFVILVIPFLTLISTIYFISIQKQFKKIEEYEGKITTIVQENLTCTRVVKAFANEKYELEKFDNVFKQYYKQRWYANLKISLFWGITELVVILVMAVTSIVSIINVYNKVMPLSALAGFMMLVGNTIWRARALGRQISEFGRTSIAVKRIQEIFAIEKEHQLDEDLVPNIEGNIEFKNVSYTFKDGKTPVLESINLTIHAGERIAIMGKTGSGKSTLIYLINRLLEPINGQVLIDGIDAKKINKKHLRKSIGIVMQEPFLYSASIQENIAIADNQIDQNLVEKVATIASVEQDINNFENKYQTIVGERGVTLSGGQKQRIAIARILTKPHPILIFDDSLSAVDTETDLKIRNALNNQEDKSTTIIITHRIVTAMQSDRIVILDAGKIVAVGSHEQLIKQPGLYQDIWKIQNYFQGGEN